MKKTWDHFRAIAARIGISRETIEEVERRGEATVVKYPLNPIIGIKVRPDPDWTARMGDAWYGELVNSRRQSAGVLPIPNGRLHVSDSTKPEQGLTVQVVAGDYEVVLTIAHLGSEAEGDYEEHVSHAHALLRGADAIATIEPMTNDDGSEVFVEAVWMGLSGPGVIEQLAAEHVDGRVWKLSDVLIPAMYATGQPGGHWARLATADGSGALISIAAGEGRGTYPVFRMADEGGNTVGVLFDFYVDNRPWEDMEFPS